MMDEPGMRKICFDLEDRPPLSYWEQRHAKGYLPSSQQISLEQTRQLKIKPEDWIKAPEFVPRSKQLLSQSFYVEPQYSLESSSKNCFEISYPFSTSLYDGINSNQLTDPAAATSNGCLPAVSAYQPQLDFNSAYIPNGTAPLATTSKKRRRRRPRKLKDTNQSTTENTNGVTLNSNAEEAQHKSKNETAKIDTITKRQQSSDSCGNSSSEDSGSKNRNSYNLHSIDDDISLFAVGGSCPELFDLQNRRSVNADEKLDLIDFKKQGTKKSPSPSTANIDMESFGKIKQIGMSGQRFQRPNYQNRNYKPPVKACMQMATFNPEYNTTSTKIVANNNKDGFIQDCFEGLNVRFNNFDDCEELTLSDTEEVSPPRLKQFPWILDKNFHQYTSLNAPGRVCCTIM